MVEDELLEAAELLLTAEINLSSLSFSSWVR
jgi:hypothetical protein